MEKYISFHGNVSLLIVLCIESGRGGKKEEKNLDILISETSLKNIWGHILRMTSVQCPLVFPSILSLPNVTAFYVLFGGEGEAGD